MFIFRCFPDVFHLFPPSAKPHVFEAMTFQAADTEIMVQSERGMKVARLPPCSIHGLKHMENAWVCT